jgi:hypothetical protein
MAARATWTLALALSACGEDSRVCLTPTAMVSGEPSGALVWEEMFAATEQDFGRGIAVDACDGRVAVGGSVQPRVIHGTSDIWIGALTHDGEPLWDRRIHEIFSEGVGSLAFTADGGLLAAGASELGPYIGSDIDAGWLGRFTPEGAESWRAHLVEDAEEHDRVDSYWFADVVVAPDGRIFLAGTQSDIYLNRYALAAAYDPLGEPLWTAIRDDNRERSGLYAVSVLPGGDILFAGRYEAPITGDPSVLLQRFSADGELLDDRVVAGLPRSIGAYAFTPTSLLLAGDEWIGELQFDGQLLREAPIAEQPSDLAPGLDGDIYMVGGRYVGAGMQLPWVARLDRELARVWHYEHDRPGHASAVVVGPSGDAFVTGSVEAPPLGEASNFSNNDIWIARFAR